MKILLLPWILLGGLLLLPSTSCSAQDPLKDSLNYYNTVVSIPKNEKDLQKAYAYFLKYHEEALKKPDTLKLVFSLQRLAKIEYTSGLYTESETTAVEALALADNYKPSPYLQTLKMTLYNLLGMVYKELHFYTKASELYTLSLSLTDNPKDSLIIYNNLGNIQLKQENFIAAKHYLSLGLDLVPKVQDSTNIARLWANYGFLEHKLNPGQGLDRLLKALNTRKKASDLAGIYYNYKLLSNYYYDLKNSEISNSYADSAYTIAKKLNSLAYEQDALRLLSTHQPEYMGAYFEISDSLTRLSSENQNKFALIKYDVAKIQNQALENELWAEKEHSKSVLLTFLIIGSSICGLAITLWLLARSRRKRLAAIYSTESQISKRIHDELANDQYQIMSLMELEGTDPKIVNRMENVYLKTRDISKSIADIDVKENFTALLKDLLLSYNTPTTSVMSRNLNNIDWTAISEVKKQALYRTLQELLTNMRKHSKATHAVVAFTSKGSKIHLEYKDNGMGCNLSKKSGLQNTENRIETLNGRVTFESQPDKGFKASILI